MPNENINRSQGQEKARVETKRIEGEKDALHWRENVVKVENDLLFPSIAPNSYARLQIVEQSGGRRIVKTI